MNFLYKDLHLDILIIIRIFVIYQLNKLLKPMKFIVFISLLIISNITFSQSLTATTDDGRTIELFTDGETSKSGTYKYAILRDQNGKIIDNISKTGSMTNWTATTRRV